MVNFLDPKIIALVVLVIDIILRKIPSKYSLSIISAIKCVMQFIHDVYDMLIKEKKI